MTEHEGKSARSLAHRLLQHQVRTETGPAKKKAMQEQVLHGLEGVR